MVFVGAKVIGNVECADDSKKLSYKQRDEMILAIKENVQYVTVITTAKEIDAVGLSLSIRKSLAYIISHFGNHEKYLYDGNNSFGFSNINTLINADALVKGVGAASIIAKHTKDAMMLSHHIKYSMYGFDTNSGYATKKHIEAIKEYGYCELHRMTYNVKSLEVWKNQKTVSMLF